MTLRRDPDEEAEHAGGNEAGDPGQNVSNVIVRGGPGGGARGIGTGTTGTAVRGVPQRLQKRSSSSRTVPHC